VDKYPKAKYVGRLETSNLSTAIAKDPQDSNIRSGYVFVTVGSTSFDGLIQFVDKEEFGKLFKRLGYSGLHIQYGRGGYLPSSKLRDSSFEIQTFAFKESLKEEMDNASLIISHAGAGSIIESLSSGKPLIVVPNESLMNNHQVQLAFKFAQLGFLQCAKLDSNGEGGLFSAVEKCQANPLTLFPKRESESFAKWVDEEVFENGNAQS